MHLVAAETIKIFICVKFMEYLLHKFLLFLLMYLKYTEEGD